jgi:hypothetical protein
MPSGSLRTVMLSAAIVMPWYKGANAAASCGVAAAGFPITQVLYCRARASISQGRFRALCCANGSLVHPCPRCVHFVHVRDTLELLHLKQHQPVLAVNSSYFRGAC